MLSEKGSEEAGQGRWGKARKRGLRRKKPHPTFVPPEARRLALFTPGLVITDQAELSRAPPSTYQSMPQSQ